MVRWGGPGGEGIVAGLVYSLSHLAQIMLADKDALLLPLCVLCDLRCCLVEWWLRRSVSGVLLYPEHSPAALGASLFL